MENKDLYRFVKVDGHTNWFLCLDPYIKEPAGLSNRMQEQILRSEVCKLHDPKNTLNFTHRVITAATMDINYERLAQKYGTILIRPIGSFMPLYTHTIVEEIFDTDFPIEEFAEIVICENDQKAEPKWVEYLKSRFPKKKILTINFFDLRSENEVMKYFEKAQYITFSTTFSRYEWFYKLSKLVLANNSVLGYCHDSEKWEKALQINQNIEIVTSIEPKY